MDRITFLSLDKKIRITVTHGVTTDLQFTLPVPASCVFDKKKTTYSYFAESLEYKAKTQYETNTLKIVFDPKQLSSTLLGNLESLDTYRSSQGYVIKAKPDAVNAYEPEVRIESINYEFVNNQHDLLKVTVEMTMTDAVVNAAYNLV